MSLNESVIGGGSKRPQSLRVTEIRKWNSEMLSHEWKGNVLAKGMCILCQKQMKKNEPYQIDYAGYKMYTKWK